MKARVKNRVILFVKLVFTACFIILNPSCGLDNIMYLYGPSVNAPPIYSASNTIPYTNRYFEFTTNSRDASQGDFAVIGTDVYYKIYANLSTCANEYSALNTMANTESSKYNSASSLINSYKFQKLSIERTDGGRNDEAFYEHDGSNDTVTIRLTTYLQNPTSEEFSAFVRFKKNGEEKTVGVPIRYYGNRYFDFHRNATNYYAPSPGTTSFEDDLSTNTSATESGKWYITLYAVTVGRDNAFTPMYSPIVHLGTLAIDANSYDN